jgi:Zn-dependent protease with chaperone function/uncharacterized tellurite resistance protein B-like protein
MNFFESEERARRRTGRLVALFAAAVVCIVIAVNLVANGLLRLVDRYGATRDEWQTYRMENLRAGYRNQPSPQPDPLWQRPQPYIATTCVTLIVIASGTLYKIAQLGGGGAAVAQLFGARLLLPGSQDPDERTLLNIVEEMSIAAGLTVPPVYVMDDELGINAFAAGSSPRQAIICVTRGCMQKLSRDELQGVVAHEFSHILNGDMALNLKLIGLLHGIFIIGLIGYGMIRGSVGSRSSSSDKDDAGAALLILSAGVGLLIIGFIGVFFGRLIQAAVSRQREFLADASAVQFTRNPDGIAGALKKIGQLSSRSYVGNAHAMEVAHLFFAGSMSLGLARLLDTHPPIVDRIRAIEPGFDGVFPKVAPPTTLLDRYGAPRPANREALRRAQAEPDPAARASQAAAINLASGLAGSFSRQLASVAKPHLRFATRLVSDIPQDVMSACRDPFSARAVVFCLLIDPSDSIRDRQIELLRQISGPEVAQQTTSLLPAIRELGDLARLPLLDLATAALKHLSLAQRQAFLKATKALIDADARISMSEFTLARIVGRALAGSTESAAPRDSALAPLTGEALTLLAALAFVDGSEPQAAAQALRAGAARLDMPDAPTPSSGPSLEQLDQALRRLADASIGVKRRLLDACAHTVAADGIVQTAEAELLRAISASLDCPLPPFVEHT